MAPLDLNILLFLFLTTYSGHGYFHPMAPAPSFMAKVGNYFNCWVCPKEYNQTHPDQFPLVALPLSLEHIAQTWILAGLEMEKCLPHSKRREGDIQYIRVTQLSTSEQEDTLTHRVGAISTIMGNNSICFKSYDSTGPLLG